VRINFTYCVFLQLYNKGGNYEKEARAELISLVHDAGKDGFTTLVRALAKNDQEDLARKLDEEIAEKYIVRPPEAASTFSYKK